jgi:hypothetical protein
MAQRETTTKRRGTPEHHMGRRVREKLQDYI